MILSYLVTDLNFCSFVKIIMTRLWIVFFYPNSEQVFATSRDKHVSKDNSHSILILVVFSTLRVASMAIELLLSINIL